MIGYLKAVFEWLSGIGGVLWTGLYDVLRKFKWFFVALIAAVLAPIKWVFEFVVSITEKLVEATESLVDLTAALGMDSANTLWASVGSGAALMNCVVPLDYCVTVFGAVLSIWLVIVSIKGAVWLYRLIPFKAS